MKNSRFVAVAAMMLAAGAVIALQYARNEKLKAEAESLRARLTASTAGTHVARARSSNGLKLKGANADAEGRVADGAPALTNLKEILATRDPMRRMHAMLQYVENLPVDQIGGALLELRAGSPDWDPEAKFVAHMLLTRWGQEDPDAAFASVAELGVKRGGGDATSILASLAAVDPKRAVEWLNDPDNALQQIPKMGHILAGTIAREWVRQDPGAAMEWAMGLPDEQRRGALRGVLESLASTDPGAAAELVMSLEAGKERGGLVGDIAESWGRRTPESALDWAQSLEGGERAQAIEDALDGWAQTSPSDAGAFIDNLAADERTERQIAQVAREWGRRDPAEAASWLDTQPEGEGKAASIGEVMWNWTNTDPAAASTWLAEQPAGESYDNGASALSKATFESDPATAITWAASIGNERQRTEMIDGGLRWWNGRDPEGAQSWATENGITLPQSDRGNGGKQ